MALCCCAIKDESQEVVALDAIKYEGFSKVPEVDCEENVGLSASPENPKPADPELSDIKKVPIEGIDDEGNDAKALLGKKVEPEIPEIQVAPVATSNGAADVSPGISSTKEPSKTMVSAAEMLAKKTPANESGSRDPDQATSNPNKQESSASVVRARGKLRFFVKLRKNANEPEGKRIKDKGWFKKALLKYKVKHGAPGKYHQESTVESTVEPERPTTGNTNIPWDYMWLSDTLRSLTKCEAHTLGVVDLANGTPFTPLFLCVGGCPNSFCGMQAIMFSVDVKKTLDFWWVKPIKGTNQLEKETLSRHAKGPHKNDPGRSKAFYKPLGDLFGNGKTQGGQTFGIEVFDSATNGNAAKSARAYFENSKGEKQRQYLSLIWQEDWTSNPLAWSQYIKGKLIYQKDLSQQVFNARDYKIVDGKVSIGDKEDKSFKDMLPGNWVKDLTLNK